MPACRRFVVPPGIKPHKARGTRRPPNTKKNMPTSLHHGCDSHKSHFLWQLKQRRLPWFLSCKREFGNVPGSGNDGALKKSELLTETALIGAVKRGWPPG